MKPEEITEEETPECERYEDDSTSMKSEEREEVDQEALGIYLQAEVLLPIAGEMITGKIVRRKRDIDGNFDRKIRPQSHHRHEDVCCIFPER
jgi:hypothetical protein